MDVGSERDRAPQGRASGGSVCIECVDHVPHRGDVEHVAHPDVADLYTGNIERLRICCTINLTFEQTPEVGADIGDGQGCLAQVCAGPGCVSVMSRDVHVPPGDEKLST